MKTESTSFPFVTKRRCNPMKKILSDKENTFFSMHLRQHRPQKKMFLSSSFPIKEKKLRY
jgi:hypothetical protein